ncbi:hypothetical protein vBPaeMUSP18_37 [Pseudomonas phage vB_PaeM_USP_18]|nr:hypothetical protein vBPaeMUSP18_37 [Pseudomonas phage vB_PaeM_USP_18]QLI49500.1 hypothetical protein vBPaeMUSP25_37 [Pseudomonas phage vB_PaeM_USP_25]
MNIDLRKVPERATHYSHETEGRRAAYWRLEDGKAREVWIVETDGCLWHAENPKLSPGDAALPLIRRLYLSGPMSGLPEFNYPAFHAEAGRLRALGYHVENPAENDAPPCGTWQAFMRKAIAQLITCEAVALLPGWTESRGALLERQLAVTLGMPTVQSARITNPHTEAQTWHAELIK